MKIWHVVVSSLLGLTLAGCRSDPEIAYLQRDNLNKQRKIERLQNQVEDLKEALNTAAPPQPGTIRDTPPAEMQSAPRTFDGGRSSPARTYPAQQSAPPATPPARTYSEPDAPVPGIPHIDINPGQEIKPGSPSSGGSTQWSPAGGQPRDGLASSDNSSVAQITLHPALTGGIGASDQPGDKGLLVVVEPRDFGGNIVNTPGNISVALLDPALSGEQARLARWDFSAAETQGMIRTGSQPGIHLRLPWTSTPAHDRLKVFVRYTTRDGRRLQADRLIGVALNGPPPARREDLPDTESAQTASRPQRPQWSPVR